MLAESLALALIVATSTVPGVESFVKEALEAHPTVDAAQQRALAARQRVGPAGAWDDPMLSVGIQNLPYDPFSLNATPMSGVRVGISQRIPWPGKRGLAEDAARSAAASAQARIAEQKNALAAAVRSVYFDIHLIDVSKQVLTKNLSLLDRFIEIADAKYRVGNGRQQDVLRARVARNELEEELLGVERRRASLVERLRNLLARTEPLELPPLVDVAVSAPRQGLEQSSLLARARAERPRLRALLQAVEGAHARAALADKAALPDVGVSLSYTFRGDAGGRDPVDGADFLGLGLSVGLPVFYGSKQGPIADAARADQAAVQAELQSATLEIRELVDRALVELPRLEGQMRKYSEDIIPTTEQALEAELVAYQVDKVSFLDLLDLEMKLVRYQIDFHRLHVAHEKILVGLAYALGVAPTELAQPGGHGHHHHGGHR